MFRLLIPHEVVLFLHLTHPFVHTVVCALRAVGCSWWLETQGTSAMDVGSKPVTFKSLSYFSNHYTTAPHNENRRKLHLGGPN